MNTSLIQFKMDGPALVDAMPLREVIVALTEFQHIVDKSYLCCTGGKKLSYSDRKNYAIVATDFRKGSFSADMQLIVAAAAPLLPHVTVSNVKDIWEVVKGAYDLLKTIAEMRSSGVEPVITVDGDMNAPVIVGNNITISNTVFCAADRTEPNFKKITSIIDPRSVEFIESFDEERSGFRLTEEDKNLFHPKTRLEKDVFTIECDIFKFDKESRVGRLRVFEGQAIPAIEYKFKPILAEISYQFIQAMGRRSIKLNVMKEIEIHTTGIERISSLRVVSVDGFSEPGLFE